MDDIILRHFYIYLPFGFSFLALYLKVVRAVKRFGTRHIGDIISRLLYTLFFGFATYHSAYINTMWFRLIALGTLILFINEVISYFFREEFFKQIETKFANDVLDEIWKLRTGRKHG